MHRGGSNEIPKVVGLDKSFKSPLVDNYKDIEEQEEQVEDNELQFKKQNKVQQTNDVFQHLHPKTIVMRQCNQV